MWTIVRFALWGAHDYGEAFELLAGAGFARHPAPAPDRAEPFPAAVVVDRCQDPAVVTRAVFEALHGAGLRPMGVIAAPLDAARAPRGRAALARA